MYRYFAGLFFLVVFNLSAQNSADSLRKVIAQPQNYCKGNCLPDTIQLNAQMELAMKLQAADPRSGLAEHARCLISAVQLRKKFGSNHELKEWIFLKAGMILRQTGSDYFLFSDYKNAASYYLLALNFGELLANSSDKKINYGAKKLYAATFGNIGSIYHIQGNYPMALDYYFKALKRNEENNDYKGQASNLSNIGAIYANEKQQEKSYEYYKRAGEINRKLGNKYGEANTLANMSTYLNDKRRYSEALQLIKRAQELDQEIGNENGQAINLGYMGVSYTYLGDSASKAGNKKLAEDVYWPKALECFLEVKRRNSVSGDQMSELYNYNSMGVLYKMMGRNNEAKEAHLKSLKLSEELKVLEGMMLAHGHLSEIFESNNDYKNAITNYKQYILYKDSVYSEENNKAQVQKEMMFAFAKKNTADSISREERRKMEAMKNKAEINRQKNYTYAGIAGFLIMGLITFISIRAFVAKKKANREIAEQKLLVEEKQREVLDSIRYAKRIQMALITNEHYIGQKLSKLNSKELK